MVEKKLVDYLLEGKKRGFSVQMLKHKLLDIGWDEATVNEAVNFVEKQSSGMESKKIPSVDLRINSQVAQPNSQMQSQPMQNMQKTQNDMQNKMLSDFKPGEKKPGFGIFKKIGMLLSKPSEIFGQTQSEGIGAGLKYLLVVSIVPFAIGALIIALATSLVLGYLSTIIPSASGLSGGITLYSILLLAFYLFIASPILIFIGGGIVHLFVKMFRGQGSYANTFNALVYGATPLLLFFFVPFIGIWGFILNIFGIASYHKISKGKAFLALFMFGIVVVIIITILMLIFGKSLPSGAVQ